MPKTCGESHSSGVLPSVRLSCACLSLLWSGLSVGQSQNRPAEGLHAGVRPLGGSRGRRRTTQRRGGGSPARSPPFCPRRTRHAGGGCWLASSRRPMCPGSGRRDGPACGRLRSRPARRRRARSPARRWSSAAVPGGCRLPGGARPISCLSSRVGASARRGWLCPRRLARPGRQAARGAAPAWSWWCWPCAGCPGHTAAHLRSDVRLKDVVVPADQLHQLRVDEELLFAHRHLPQYAQVGQVVQVA